MNTTKNRLPDFRAGALLLGVLACPSTSNAVSSVTSTRVNAEPAGTGETPAVAPVDATARVAGAYRFVGGDKERQRLDDAIEDVVADMNFIARPIARRRLRDSNLPSAALNLAVTTDEITIGRPGQPTVAAPRDGSMILWTSPDGDEFEVRHRLPDHDTVTQDFVGDGNHSTNVFTLKSDGKHLAVKTTITADRLPKPLVFTMTYQRKGSPG